MGQGAVVPPAPAPWLADPYTIPVASLLTPSAGAPMSVASPTPPKRPRLHSPSSPPHFPPAQIANESHSRTNHLLSEHALGKSARSSALAYTCLGSWEAFVASLRITTDIAPGVRHIPHKAGRLLDHLHRRGTSVPLRTPPWTPSSFTAPSNVVRTSPPTTRGIRLPGNP